MINLLIDIIQSLSICVIAITVIFLTVRVNRHDTRLDAQKTAKELQEAHQAQWQEPEALCGCKHHHCFHDESGCGYSQQVYEFNSTRSPLGDIHCGCKRYTGPEPLPQVIP